MGRRARALQPALGLRDAAFGGEGGLMQTLAIMRGSDQAGGAAGRRRGRWRDPAGKLFDPRTQRLFGGDLPDKCKTC